MAVQHEARIQGETREGKHQFFAAREHLLKIELDPLAQKRFRQQRDYRPQDLEI
jgi:hypothetical protein